MSSRINPVLSQLADLISPLPEKRIKLEKQILQLLKDWDVMGECG
jgi:hypothetical protein